MPIPTRSAAIGNRTTDGTSPARLAARGNTIADGGRVHTGGVQPFLAMVFAPWTRRARQAAVASAVLASMILAGSSGAALARPPLPATLARHLRVRGLHGRRSGGDRRRPGRRPRPAATRSRRSRRHRRGPHQSPARRLPGAVPRHRPLRARRRRRRGRPLQRAGDAVRSRRLRAAGRRRRRHRRVCARRLRRQPLGRADRAPARRRRAGARRPGEVDPGRPAMAGRVRRGLPEARQRGAGGVPRSRAGLRAARTPARGCCANRPSCSEPRRRSPPISMATRRRRCRPAPRSSSTGR